MTNRQNLKRRMVLGSLLAFAAWLALVGAMLVSQNEPPALLIGIGMGLFLVIALFLQFGIRCLLCGGNLGLTIGHAAFSFPGRKRVVNYCPYCGTSLDEPYDAARQAAARERAKQRAA